MRQPSTLDLSSLFFIPLRAEAPSTPLSRSPPAPTSPHRRPVRIVLSLSFPLGQVRLSGPSHSPYPCLQPRPRPLCLSNLTLANLLPLPVVTYPSPPSCTAVIPSSSISLSFSFSPSLAYLRLLTTFTRSSVSAPPCQFLCETTNGACSLPTYLATYPASWLATYFHKIRWRL